MARPRRSGVTSLSSAIAGGLVIATVLTLIVTPPVDAVRKEAQRAQAGGQRGLRPQPPPSGHMSCTRPVPARAQLAGPLGRTDACVRICGIARQ